MELMISSKKLSNTDVGTRLSVQTRSLDHFPTFAAGQYSQYVNIEDEGGEVWSFRLVKRRGPYPKPVLSAGWRKFVQKKKLQKGFEVQFFKERDEVIGEFKYKIKLKKPIVLFKVVIGHAPLRAV